MTQPSFSLIAKTLHKKINIALAKCQGYDASVSQAENGLLENINIKIIRSACFKGIKFYLFFLKL